jgi:alpha-ketoglutarate-dependent taurine dioxygenase
LLPRHAYYGDGAEIAIEQLETVRTAFAEEQVAFAWQAGDILLLDNMRVAHGRRPFTGSRSVLAALLDPYPSA